jgi:hypothetical protein
MDQPAFDSLCQRLRSGAADVLVEALEAITSGTLSATQYHFLLALPGFQVVAAPHPQAE